MVISIGELQRNISLLKTLKEPLIVIDKRTNKKVAIIEPIKEESEVEKLEIFKEKPDIKNIHIKDVDKAFEEAYTEFLREKYGISG
ncbi:hypothetical protein [Nitratiruptor sp. SB155-2]|uniref:hypothetical protein n=1 Tax=Nitratiruptor sp. (strain SB155-2) TaxID=387092 RepID=UPI0001587225|nr:hypothetical protein [Nitratiruptor sp. SB155-2]BAF70380.1 hypothetical protein NIS_1272 [Nitratiruptor sp. SB155-2]